MFRLTFTVSLLLLKSRDQSDVETHSPSHCGRKVSGKSKNDEDGIYIFSFFFSFFPLLLGGGIGFYFSIWRNSGWNLVGCFLFRPFSFIVVIVSINFQLLMRMRMIMMNHYCYHRCFHYYHNFCYHHYYILILITIINHFTI